MSTPVDGLAAKPLTFRRFKDGDAKPLVRAQATYAIDHCGLDAVLNLFA